MTIGTTESTDEFLWPPVLDKLSVVRAGAFSRLCIKAVEQDHFLIGDIDDGRWRCQVIIESPRIDTGDIGMTGLGGVNWVSALPREDLS